MKINTSKSRAMVLCLKTMGYLLWMGTELMPQAKEVKHLRVLYTSDRKMEWEIDRWFGEVSVITQRLYQTIKVENELSRKVKFSMGSDRKDKVMVPSAKMRFLLRVAALSLRDRVRGSEIWSELRVERLLLGTERN